MTPIRHSIVVSVARSAGAALRRATVASAALTALAGAAAAQSSSSPTNFDQRPQLDGRERAVGARIGTFLLTPEITLGSSYSDNYLLEDVAPDASFIFTATPAATLASDWNRHALRFEIGAEQAFFLADADDNYLDFHIRGRGQIDVTRSLATTLSGGFAHLHEGRGADDVVDPTTGLVITTEPVEFDRLHFDARTDYKPGRIRLTPYGGAAYLDFDDTPAGTPALSNQDDRDRLELRGGGEIGFEFSRGYEAFIGGEYLSVDYDLARDDLGINRDSTGYNARGGVNFRISRLVTGSLGAGYLTRDYTDPALTDVNGVLLDASAIWTPTPSTTIKLSAGRDVEETTIPDASGATELFGRVELDHAFRRNIVFNLFAAAAMEEFEGADREDDNFRIGVGAEWLITRYFAAEASYAYETETSTDETAGYDVNRFFLGLSARY